ncbi:protein AMN1 homolog [Centruroides vittatus]|uniref:protein AMN1 homolog n=1 Tax=Centruroides vittatus TaxID=120091 RepID=UPI00350EB83F
MSQVQSYEALSLFECSVNAFVEFLHRTDNWDVVRLLPIRIKDVLFSMLSVRGKVMDKNIEAVLHKKVKVANLMECEITDYGLLQLAECEELQMLNLASVDPRENISSSAFATVFDSCRKLREVCLSHCVNIADDAVYTLAVSCPNLACLDISNCINLTNRSLEALGMFAHNLECINFSNTMVHDEGVRLLVNGACKDKLKEICMKNCCFLTSNAVKHVADNCSNLSIFTFDEYPVIYYESDREMDSDPEIEFFLNDQRHFRKQISWTIS